jgi:hypothetical protein
MRKLFFAIFFLCFIPEIHAQTGFAPGEKIGFEYDAAGNRKKRFLIEVSPCPSCPGQRNSGPQSGSVSINANQNKLSINVFPNPTDKDITVQINGFEILTEKPDLSICDVNGKTVLTRQLNSYNSLIDLSELTRGTYYLYVNTEYNKMTYKVIKSK